MSVFAGEIVTWALAALLALAASGVPLAAVWRWRRHPVPTAFLVLAGFALAPWALHEAELAYRLSLFRRVEAGVRRDFGVRPGVELHGDAFNRMIGETHRRVRADPIFAFNMRTGVGRWLQDDSTRTLSWLAACSLLLVAAGHRSRWGRSAPPAVD